MSGFAESKPCVECDGVMDRRHGTLPSVHARPVDIRHIPTAQVAEIGTYYRCLKNGAHTVIVARDAKIKR
jgi:hypothetical protein